ncbi:MAG: DUF2085 domain-containing protein [Anaerolineales bacterium]|nr:DUF2085 domain-containing protein [Anaerolineales bacterium]
MERVLSSISLRRVSWNIPVLVVVGLLFLGWLLNTPPGLLGKADAVGYAVCHRIDTRSFHLGDRQIPLCARCTGMYLGAMLGLVYQQFLGRRRAGMPPWKVLVVLAALVLAFAVDGLNSYLHFFPNAPTLYEPQNWSRLLTGTGMGLVIAAALFPAFNQAVWKYRDPRPALGGLLALAGMVLLALLLDLVVLTENPLVLYPLSLISAAGVIVLLTIVYCMILLVIFRAEHKYSLLYQLWLPLTGGFGMALLQIALLDLGRYLLTGTWEGFHLG